MTLAKIEQARPLEEWQEDYGNVVWWTWRDGQWLGEPAYIGTPLDLGQTIEIELRHFGGEFVHQHQVGGWPGYHTHWTPHPNFPQGPANHSASTHAAEFPPEPDWDPQP